MTAKLLSESGQLAAYLDRASGPQVVLAPSQWENEIVLRSGQDLCTVGQGRRGRFTSFYDGGQSNVHAPILRVRPLVLGEIFTV